MPHHSPSVSSPSPPLPAGVRRLYERSHDGFAAVTLTEWTDRFPWLVQGTTTRGKETDGGAFDLRLFPESPGARERWRALLTWCGLPSAVHAPQVHEDRVRRHSALPAHGLRFAPECDGHLTEVPGLLLTVSVADCVPVYVLDPIEKRVGMIHAGWRSAAAGILENGLEAVPGADAGVLRVHLGPSICGACYEVGGEVFEALGLPRPDIPTPIDLRAVLAGRAVDAGVSAENVTVSGHCTLCGPARDFFSHRGGDEGRQVGFVGIRP